MSMQDTVASINADKPECNVKTEAGTGENWGRFIGYTPTDNSQLWVFNCECGNSKTINKHHVKSGRIKSCGCLKAEKLKERGAERRKDIADKMFGRLKAIKRIGASETSGHSIWECKCDCGKKINVEIKNLNKKNGTRSCGCLSVDRQKDTKSLDAPHFEGTHVARIKHKNIAKTNRTGLTGVSYNAKRKKWRAYINFKGRRYSLGEYSQKKDAAKARKDAEAIYHDAFIEYHENLVRAAKESIL